MNNIPAFGSKYLAMAKENNFPREKRSSIASE